MKYNTQSLLAGGMNQAIADRIWADLVSVLLHSGSTQETNRIALEFLKTLNDMGPVPDHITVHAVLNAASKWLDSL